jgi:hypothetical protein
MRSYGWQGTSKGPATWYNTDQLLCVGLCFSIEIWDSWLARDRRVKCAVMCGGICACDIGVPVR